MKLTTYKTIAILLATIAALYSDTPPTSDQSIPARTQVSLAWDPNTETDIEGYKVYYGTTPGAYANWTETSENKVTVELTEPSKTYYFVVTANNKAGLESLPSNEVSSPSGAVKAPGAPTNVIVIIVKVNIDAK